jgi:hypothetical protein
MRTRNKQTAKEQASKRPKRGTETPDATATAIESPCTPNRNAAGGNGGGSESNKKKSTNNSKDTPTKQAKKRINNDLDNEIDEKDGIKRKRSDVSYFFKGLLLSALINFQVFFKLLINFKIKSALIRFFK